MSPSGPERKSGAGKRVCLGAFAGAYGVRGEARIKAFTDDPLSVGAYGPLEDEAGGRQFTIESARPLKGDFIAARVAEIPTREAAMALKGVRLYVDRARLPEPDDDDEFYFEDLVGLAVQHVDGRAFGRVKSVLSQGPTDLIEIWRIPGLRGSHFLPFTKDAVPEVDVAGGRLVVDPPLGLIESDDEGAA
ncbi:MAG: ribosome maturation factor RimM [Pseudomonadota bacterium]